MSYPSPIPPGGKTVTAAAGDNTVELFTVPVGHVFIIYAVNARNTTTAVVEWLRLVDPDGNYVYIDAHTQVGFTDGDGLIFYDATGFAIPERWRLELVYKSCVLNDVLTSTYLVKVVNKYGLEKYE